MARIARMIIKGEAAVYHVISRTALDGYVLGDIEKEYLFGLIKKLSSLYFTELLGYCIMGTHLHLLVRMHPESSFSDKEIRRRFQLYHSSKVKKKLTKSQISSLRTKWEDLSEFVKEIKQQFTRFYNKRHNRRGFFWAERFKSLIVGNGEALINCLTYIELNPVRAGLVEKPEDYQWCSLGYHLQTKNKDNLLSMDFGHPEFDAKDAARQLDHYRTYIHDKGRIRVDQENIALPDDQKDRFRCRCRYFIDGGVIGSKEYVNHVYQQFKDIFYSKNEKKPRLISGLNHTYSLKRLME